MSKWGISERAAALYEDAIVWDMTLPWQLDAKPSQPGVLKQFQDAGVSHISLSIADDRHYRDHTVADIARALAGFRREPGVVFVYTTDEIRKAKAEGKLAVSFNFQGTNPLQRDLDMVQVYYNLGVKSAILAYNLKNSVGDGCHELTDDGLSRFGRDLVQEMNRVGMLVDCTHCGVRTSLEAIELSDQPCIFSHSVGRALFDHERNITDEQITACAKKGGVIGVNGIGAFLGNDDASVDQMVRHIEHVIKVAGPDHVGFGLDYVYFNDVMVKARKDNPAMWPAEKGYPDEQWATFPPDHLPQLTDMLLERQHSEKDVRGFLGENFLRAAHQAWR